MLILSRLFLYTLVFYQVLGTEVDLDLFGEVTYSITKESPDAQTFTCTTEKDDSGQMGTFHWLLGDVEVESSLAVEDEEQTGYVSTFEYVGQLEDDEKQLTCQYIPANGGEIGDNSVTLKIQKHILPQSPYIVDTPYKVGDTVTTSIEMDLYPKPEPRSLVWVIEDPQQIEENIELQPGQVVGSYSASELVDLGGDKFTYGLTIDALKEEDVKKNIYFLLKAVEDRKVDVQITLAKDPIEVTTVIPPKSTGMGAGLWVIVILVLLIILACIGYCIWQRWCRKKTTQEEDQEKGDFQQVPQNDSQK